MYTENTEFNKLADANPCYVTKIKYKNSSGEFVDYPDEIYNYKYNGPFNPDNGITIGTTGSASISFSVWKETVSLEDVEIKVYQCIKETEHSIPIGVFKCLKSTENEDVSEYTAYDRMTYLLDRIYNSADGLYDIRDNVFIQNVCTKFGFSFVGTLEQKTVILVQPKKYTYRQFIGYMAGLRGMNAFFDRNGNLEFKWYKKAAYGDETAYRINHDRFYESSAVKKSKKSVQIGIISCTCGYSLEQVISSGTSGMLVNITNPYMTQELLDEVLSNVSFSYYPMDVEFLGDFRLDVGDIVRIGQGPTSGFVPIMHISHESDGGIYSIINSYSLTEGGSSLSQVGSTNNIPSSVMVGATESISGQSGLVPEPIAGQQNLYLKGDGTWAEPALSEESLEAIENNTKNISLLDEKLITQNEIIENIGQYTAENLFNPTLMFNNKTIEGVLFGYDTFVDLCELNGKSTYGISIGGPYVGAIDATDLKVGESITITFIHLSGDYIPKGNEGIATLYFCLSDAYKNEIPGLSRLEIAKFNCDYGSIISTVFTMTQEYKKDKRVRYLVPEITMYYGDKFEDFQFRIMAEKGTIAHDFVPYNLSRMSLRNDITDLSKIKADKSELNSHTGNNDIHVTPENKDNWNSAKTHADSTHARTDATKVEKSSTNGNIKINGTETTVYTHPSGTNPHGTTKSDVGLGNVGNFKAVSTVSNQGLTDTEKANARTNIGAGTSSFSGSYTDLSNKPALGTASSKDVASSGNASTSQVVMGNDTRLTDSRKASDVYAWAKASTKPSYTASEVGLGNVPNVTTNDQTPEYTEATTLTGLTSGEKLSVAFGKISKAITDLISHIGDSVKHITSTERTNWNAAKTHADSEHAPSDAQANVIETVKVNGTALTPESKAVDIIVPTKVSELENDKNYLSSVPDEYVTNAELEAKGYLTEHQDISGKMDTSLKGAPNGVAELDTAGKVPSSQLPSYVIEGYLYNSKFYTDSAYTTEITGESGKIYIDLLSEKTYRWSGNTFAVVSETLALGETSSTAYRGDRGKVAYDHSQTVHAPSDAEVNQNAFSTIMVDSTTIAADSKTATLILVAGDNVTITSDATNNKITISFNGKADIATKAIQDGNGNVITSTYAKVSHTHKYAGSYSAGGGAIKLYYEVIFKGMATSDISTTLTSSYCEGYNYVGISGAINGYKFTQLFPISTFYEYGDNAKGCCIAIANGLSSSTLTGMVRFNDHDHIIEVNNITLYEVVLFDRAFGTMEYLD